VAPALRKIFLARDDGTTRQAPAEQHGAAAAEGSTR
jgi:hypothetical protein